MEGKNKNGMIMVKALNVELGCQCKSPWRPDNTHNLGTAQVHAGCMESLNSKGFGDDRTVSRELRLLLEKLSHFVGRDMSTI